MRPRASSARRTSPWPMWIRLLSAACLATSGRRPRLARPARRGPCLSALALDVRCAPCDARVCGWARAQRPRGVGSCEQTVAALDMFLKKTSDLWSNTCFCYFYELSDGQSCFPAGLRGPVFLGFSLALINSGVPPLPPCPFGPCPTPPLPREPGPCILRPFPPPATLGVPPEAGLWNLRVCPSSLRLCGALRTLDSGFCASNSGALCWRPSGLRTVDSGWVAEGMARSPDSGFWIV